jgi:hypothetical protein
MMGRESKIIAFFPDIYRMKLLGVLWSRGASIVFRATDHEIPLCAGLITVAITCFNFGGRETPLHCFSHSVACSSDNGLTENKIVPLRNV